MPDPVAFFRAVSGEDPYALMLGGAGEPSALNRWVIMGLHPRQVLSLRDRQLTINGETVRLSSPAMLFEWLEAARRAARRWPDRQAQYNLPMAGGLAGAVGYGFARWCDPAAWRWDWSPPDWPDVVLCEFQDWLFIHIPQQRLVVLSDSPEREASYQRLWAQTPEPAPATKGGGGLEVSDFSVSLDPAAFEAAVLRLKQDIQDGEIYQANLSMRLARSMRLDPLDLYARLGIRNPSPFAGFFRFAGGVIVSNSPERLLQGTADGWLQTRPIAGTRGRGATPAEDARIGESLLGNEKENAEHMMLVDLARNDLGRVCEAGTVTVDELRVLERYSHVTHLVSNVKGRLRQDGTVWGALAAMFPGGTITGCPKLRCMEILLREEPVPRGFYTGSLGYVDGQSAAMDWNILIRSAFLQPVAPLRYNAAIHVGAGIVHDAVPAHEYRECLRKAQAMLEALAGAEAALSLSPS